MSAAVNRHLPHIMGGSADVASSVMTLINGETNLRLKTVEDGISISGFVNSRWERLVTGCSFTADYAFM